MNERRSVSMYRALLRCYPRRFLEEYRLDMVQLFDDQLRDEPAIRVWLRGILDLAITVPVQHLEIHMTRPANTTVALSFASLSAASLVVGIAIGTNLAILAGAFAVAIIAGTLALFAWRGGRDVANPMPTTAHWWKFLGAGAGVLVAAIVTLTVTGAVTDPWWLPAMLTLAAAIVSAATGVVLGVAHFATGRASHAPG